MSSSRTTYLPRWSNQLTEQLLSSKSGSPSPPPPPPQSRPPPNDSGTASIVVDIPSKESGKQKAPGKHDSTSSPQAAEAEAESTAAAPAVMDSTQCQDNNTRDDHQQQHLNGIPQLWSQLAQQIPSSHQPKRKMGRISPTIDPRLEKQHTSTQQSPSSQQYHRHSWVPDNDSMIDEEDKRWPVGLILFWLGFLCPVLWWVGAFWPRHADHIGKMAHRWQWINRIMSITVCVILFLLLLAIGIWYRLSSP